MSTEYFNLYPRDPDEVDREARGCLIVFFTLVVLIIGLIVLAVIYIH